MVSLYPIYWVDLILASIDLRDVSIDRNTELLKFFGNHLRLLRIKAGLSQIELSNKAGLSKNQIGNIERGEINITLLTAEKITFVLKISLSEFFNFKSTYQ